MPILNETSVTILQTQVLHVYFALCVRFFVSIIHSIFAFNFHYHYITQASC